MSIYSPRILDRELNAAVIHLADIMNPRGYAVSADAPETFDALAAYAREHGRIAVSSEFSDGTIFGDPEVNYAFRAWHDACHLAGGFAFTLDGEAAACAMQCAQLVALYGQERSATWRAILRAEVNGQAEYVANWGEFPADQFRFDAAYLRNPEAALAMPPCHYAIFVDKV